jgi:hypothetical protein
LGNGSISFNPFLSTKKGCLNDVDNQYTNALIQSAYFIQIGNQIILRNLDGITTIILTLSSNNNIISGGLYNSVFKNFIGLYSSSPVNNNNMASVVTPVTFGKRNLYQ